MSDSTQAKNVCVVVLGDIGRSPRMQYHALSLANCTYNVNIIGYKETKLDNSLLQHSNIHIHPLVVPYPAIPLPRIINYILKTFWQTFTLLCALMFKKANYVLVQNPPAVPALLVCWLYCFFVRAKFIIDWHNYAHTIMAMNVGEQHVLVKATKFIEFHIGRKANANMCVTQAMKRNLEDKWKIEATVLYDKPPRIFHPISIEEKHNLLVRLGETYTIFGDKNSTNNTAITQMNHGNVELKADRPGILISSTSWTEDEDFSILLHALQYYEESCNDGNVHNLPDLICVITGKGPLKDHYIKQIQNLSMKHVSVITPWLEASDYPLLLATADLGVCLHTSSSGLDLPMKVVDMFGCCLPVCAYYFHCLDELVKHEINSCTFKNAYELTTQLINWFDHFPNNENQKKIEARMKAELHTFQNTRWEENWTQHALPLFK